MTWVGRCRGMNFFVIGTNKRNFSQVAMAYEHGLPCVWDNTRNLSIMFLTCEGSDSLCKL